MIVFNKNYKKAHLVRQLYSLMVFLGSVFLNLKRLL